MRRFAAEGDIFRWVGNFSLGSQDCLLGPAMDVWTSRGHGIISVTDVSKTAMEPLTPAVFHILLSLADGDKHGYGIMQEIAERTNNTMIMGPGTLYGTLKRMLEAGLVEESGDRLDPSIGEQRRRYYRVTAQGRRAAKFEAERLEALVRAARTKSLLRRPQRA